MTTCSSAMLTASKLIINLTNQFPFLISGPFRTNNVAATVTPYNHLRIAGEATQLFYDTFDSTLDTTERWNATAGSGALCPLLQGTMLVLYLSAPVSQ